MLYIIPKRPTILQICSIVEFRIINSWTSKEEQLVREDYLFTGPDWHSVDRYQRQKMVAEIEMVDPDRLLNTSVDDLAVYFSEKFQIERSSA